MSFPVNLQALPSGVFETVFTPENIRGRGSMNPLTPLSFPKSRLALWDSSPAGEKLRLQLCAYRKPRLVLLEKALRLAQRHARQNNKPHLHCFFLGSVSVDADEEGVTVTLDRFDPGRDQGGASGRVPSALLPGDVLVPCLFSHSEITSDAFQSEAELHHCFKALQQCVSSRHALDLSQLMKLRGHVICSQQSDAAAFSISWSFVCPSVRVDVQPIRSIPIIPTALLRSLTSINRPPPHSSNRQRGFLTMDQTRKLLLMLESDPKASTLPLVGLWLSGVTHVYNPQVWAWCLRFLFSSALQDRVLSESGCFLLVLFASTHTAPQVFQCRGSGPQMDYQLLTASQSVTLFQAACVEGRTLSCDLDSEEHSRQTQVFRDARSSFNSVVPPPAGLSISDQDSGVEDEDLSPRPSPSPHLPAQQSRGVQPSVPELSLLMDGSFSSNQNNWQDPGSTHAPPPPPPPAERKSSTSSSSAPKPPPPHLHSTPNSNLQQLCTCCSTHTYECTSIYSSSTGHQSAPKAFPHHHQTPLSSFKHHNTPPSSKHKPPSSHHNTPPTSTKHYPPPASHHQAPSPSSKHNSAPPSSHHQTPPPSSKHHGAPPTAPSSHHQTPPSSRLNSAPPSSHHQTPPQSSKHHGASPIVPSSHHQTPPSSNLHSTSASPPSAALPHHHNAPPPPFHHQTPTLQTAPLLSYHHLTPPFPPPPSHYPSTPSLHHHTPPSSHHCTSPHPSKHSTPPPSHQCTPPHPSKHSTPPPSHQCTPPHPSKHSTPPPSHQCTPPHPSKHSTPPPSNCPCSLPPSDPLLPHPSCVNQCCDLVGGVAPMDAYQLLLHQDRQLRLLQAQVQMLLEAQGKLQSSSQQVDTQTPRSTASIAVGTGASLFWGDPVQPLPHQEDQAPPTCFTSPPSSPTPPPLSMPAPSSSRPPPHADTPAEDGDVTGQEAAAHSFSGLQSPVLGESVSMITPADEQQSFYHNLMTQLNSRLQESDSRQEEAEDSRRSSLPAAPDCSSSSSSSSHSSSSSSRRKQQSRGGDPVLSATLKRLQQLGVDVDDEDLTEAERRKHQTVESSSTLAAINPAAVLSRLSVTEPTVSALFPGGSVDLSLEANAIALRYLSDSQLSRLSLGGRAPQLVPTSSNDSVLSPSNMSLATRKYMKRYGLIEEADEEEEEEKATSTRSPLTDALNVKLLPQSQLIRDLKPKMQLLASSARPLTANKENCSGRRPSLVSAGSRQTEGSVGNILDLSRLRQLPKLF
ncbi:SCL-interrupting locus protein homolog isoform X2 [Cheilinus undulatus]|uniref:SCL-interrupting locus protein homolog isoform X2 n=1 Tax=Cheilinus undulatus TaxID=241271 RepID=UPI001BD58D85|nr:SCL-interrupting locus protein homolog isoform X2 [Cheilinus undulatus]